MKYLILITIFATSSFAYAINFKEFCSEGSKDPKCWENTTRLNDEKLVCSSEGTVYFETYHGEGSGCGESGSLFITNQYRDWDSKTIYIETGWLPGKKLNLPIMCKYWGPIRGGGSVETYMGTWSVFINMEYFSSYTYSEKIESDSESAPIITKSCKIN